MNQIKIGNYIQLKRKAKNMTQEQFAEKLGISNKTISKWECGKSLPDYSLIEKVCGLLEITVAELLNGEDHNQIDDKQILELLERIQSLENQKKTIFGMLLIILGIACFCLSQLFEGGTVQEFISGFMIGISLVEMLAGVFITAFSFSKQ